jgi:hypothetical protein
MSSQQATPSVVLFNRINVEKNSNTFVSISRAISQDTSLDGIDLVHRTRSLLAWNGKETGNSEHLEEAISALERTLAEGGGQVQPIVLGYLGA